MSIVVLLISCTMPGASTSTEADAGLVAWLDQPLSGATIPLAPFALKSHAQMAGGGVEAIEFQINGVMLTSVSTDASLPLVFAEFEWNPSAAGEYKIRAVAIRGGVRSESAAALVCVSGEVKEASLGFSSSDCGESLAAPAGPTVESTPSQLQLDFKFGAAPNPVYYGQCNAELRTLAFDAIVYDISTGNPIDASLVSSVGARYVIRNAAGASGEFLLSLTDLGGGMYQNSIDINEKALSTLGSGDGTIEFWIEVLDAGGATARSLSQSLSLVDCKGGVAITTTVPAPGITVPPPPPPQLSTNTPVPPKPADTTPPFVDVNFVSATDTYYSSGCGPNTFTVQALVTDDTGIGSVSIVLSYIGVGETSIPMYPIGGNAYEATYDVGSQAYSYLGGANGQIGLRAYAYDLSGNSADDGGGVINVLYCPG